MKRLVAVTLEGTGALAFGDVAMPDPGPGEVRLRVEAVGLGFVDGLLIAGKYQWKPPLPYVPGGEIVGVVDALGEGVSDWRVGQRVAAWTMGGGLAEACILPAARLVAVPPAMAPQVAAAVLLDYGTADYALNVRGAMQAGETVFVLGASGGVGGAALEISRADGAHVIAGVSGNERRDAARAKGAAATVDLSDPAWREELRQALGGRGLDIVVDPLGGDFTEAAFRSLGKRGRHLVVGFAAGRIPALPANLALVKSAALVGVDFRYFAEEEADRYLDRLGRVLERLGQGELRPPAINLHDFASAPAAFDGLGGRGQTGKPVVLVTG